jgi:putative hydrolase of the HAD superfamily
MKYRHIFFDLDRTLWDFEVNSKETFIEIFYKYQINNFCTFEDFHSEYKKINDNLWSEYRLGNISKDKLSWQRFYKTLLLFNVNDEITAKKMSQDYVNISPTKTKLFPHSIEILQYLSKSYKLHIITNGFKEVQYLKINNCGINKFFTGIFTSEEVGCNKPNLDFFKFALSKTGAKAEESLVIGDDLQVDIKGAANLNIDTVWFNPNREKEDFRPVYEIHSLKELLNLI